MLDNNSVPSWASFFTHDEYATFLAEVVSYLNERDIDGAINDGVVHVEATQQSFGLQNLAQVCNQNESDQWRQIIFQHFDAIYGSVAADDFAAVKGAQFEDLRAQLAVRLQPEDILNTEAGKHLVYRINLPGTVSLLALDMPTAISSVTWEMVESWGKSVDDLFDIALANLKEKSTATPELVETDSNTQIYTFFSEDFFVTTQALFIETYADTVGTYGALVAVPHRHAMLCYPIYDMGVLDAISAMLPATIGMYSEGPGSLSAQLYWYDGDAFILLPYQLDGAQLNFEPPQAFVTMLENLAQSN